MSILVLAATAGEVARLRTDIDGAGRSLPSLELLVGGLGLVNTAHALTRRLATGPRPSLVIQTGIAGGYVGAKVSVGSAVLANEEVYGDLGVLTPEGWQSAETIGIPLVDATPTRPARFNHFPLDPALVGAAERVCGGRVARTGRFLTLSQVTGVRTLGDALFERFGALCESMEGAAAAHVCALSDVPFLEVRGISNLVVDRDRSTWRIAEAVEAAHAAVWRLVEQADRFVSLRS